MHRGVRTLIVTAVLAVVFCVIGVTPTKATTPCEPLASDKGQLSFTVNIAEADTYVLWLRMMNPTTDTNSLFVQIDGQCPIVVGDSAVVDSPIWVNYASGDSTQPLLFDLAAGDHTVTFAGREAKSSLDTFIFVTDQDCMPVGMGDECVANPKPTTEQVEAAAKAAAKNPFIWIICLIVGLATLGFLWWKYRHFATHTLPVIAPIPPNAVTGGPGHDHSLMTKLQHFVSHHRITVAVCAGIIIAATVTGIAFASSSRFEAENGTLSGGARIVDDLNASSGKYVLFDTNAIARGEQPQPATGGGTGGGSGGGGGGGTGGGGTGGGGGGEDPAPNPCPSFPNDSCTGYEHTGVVLKDASTVPGLTYLTDGRLVINTDGQVIDGLDIGVCVEIRAKNVVIKRSRIRGSCSEGGINSRGPAVSVAEYTLIQDVEIDGMDLSFTDSGLAGEYFICERCKVHRAGTHARPGGFAIIRDSYLYDNHYGGSSHNSGISMHDEGYVDIIHNTIRCDASNNCSGGVQLYAKDRDLAWLPDKVLRNIKINNNLIFSETGYCINGGWQSGGSTQNIEVIGNAFMASPLFPSVTIGCGDLGPTSAWPTTQQMIDNNIVWSGNYQYPSQTTVVNP